MRSVERPLERSETQRMPSKNWHSGSDVLSSESERRSAKVLLRFNRIYRTYMKRRFEINI